MNFKLLSIFLFAGIKLIGQENIPCNNIIDGIEIPEHKPSKSIICNEPLPDIVWNKIDTVYYKNGKVESITEIDSLYRRVGIYKKFDTTGVLIEEGKFGQIDSSECLNCYDGISGHDFPGRWYNMNKIEVGELKIGQWFTYHSNGKMATAGHYDTLFTIYHHAVDPKGANRPVPVGLHIEQLKTGIWRYYDENGEIYLKEEYYRGTLVFKLEYE